MKVVKLSEEQTVPNPRGISVKHLIARKNVAISTVLLQPGQNLPLNTTHVDVFFYVIAGKGKVQLGDKVAAVNGADLVFSPAGIPHGLTADESNFFSVMVVKTPNPK